MLKLKRIQIKNFRSFQDQATIDLPPNGLVLIDGTNNDTGGSSGSGKTSIIEAIAYALGYSTIPATELKYRLANGAMEVRLTLSTENGDVIICRGGKSFVEYPDGTKVIGAKNMQEAIGNVVGLPVDLMEALTYRPQRSFGRFVTMTDSEKKEFLTNCLPELEQVEKVAEEARIKSISKKSEIDAISTSLSMLGEERTRLEGIEIKDPPTFDLLSVRLDREQKNHARLFTVLNDEETDLMTVTKVYEDKKQELSNSFSDALLTKKQLLASELSTQRLVVDANKDEVGSINNEIRLIQEASQDALNYIDGQLQDAGSRRQELKTVYDQKGTLELQVVELKKTLVELEKNNCPTCLRQWEKAQTKMEDIRVKLAHTKKLIEATIVLGSKIEVIEKEMTALEIQKGTIQLDVPAEIQERLIAAAAKMTDSEFAYVKLKADLDNLESNTEAALDKDLVESKQAVFDATNRVNKVDSDIALSKKEMGNLAAQIEMVKTQIKAYEESKRAVAKTLAGVLGKIESKQAGLAGATLAYALECSVYDALGRQGYLGSIFDEILDEISEEVTDVISTIPNVNSVSLRFVSESETKSGKTKRSITPLVLKDGIETPLRTLSGGQRSSVELAVDLAIGNVIRRRTGRTPGWMVLDESFDGMDLPTKEICMELLNKYAIERLILIVDHTTEVKEGFDKSIRVTFTDGRSRIA